MDDSPFGFGAGKSDMFSTTTQFAHIVMVDDQVFRVDDIIHIEKAAILGGRNPKASTVTFRNGITKTVDLPVEDLHDIFFGRINDDSD